MGSDLALTVSYAAMFLVWLSFAAQWRSRAPAADRTGKAAGGTGFAEGGVFGVFFRIEPGRPCSS